MTKKNYDKEIDLNFTAPGNKIMSSFYSLNTIKEFRELSRKYLGSITFDQHGSFKTGPFTTKFMNDNEKAQSIEAQKKQKTDYHLDEFVYNVNDYGFRGDWDLLDVSSDSIATFGCSFTFGVGCSEENLWPFILSKNLGRPVYNFGVGGTSIEHSALLYSILNRLVRFQTVVVLIPSFSRVMFPVDFKPNNIGLMNFLPNFRYSDPMSEAIRNKVYNLFDDTYHQYRLCMSIDNMINIASLNNTKIYFSSWDMKTYKILHDAFNGRVNILPFHQTHRGKYFARDGGHAGKESNHYMANVYADIISKTQ